MDHRHMLFDEIDAHLLNDDRPSLYFQQLASTTFETEHPFTMLFQLRNIAQSSKYHPEGSVWNHTLLVIDEAAVRKAQASDSRVFIWSALLHDIGKSVMTKVRRGKITAYNHDRVGAEMAREFLLEFETYPFISKVVMLVRWHMQILYVAKELPFADISTMRQEANLRDIALLGLCDRLGRFGVDRFAEEQTVKEFLRKVDSSG